MRIHCTNPRFLLALFACFLLATTAGRAGVVTTLGAPTSNHTTPGDLPTWGGIGDLQDATFSAYIDFSANTSSTQLIWETGNGGIGASLLYENGSLLRLRAIQGNNISELTWNLTADQLASGELFVGWVFDMGNSEMRLVMDSIGGAAAPTTLASTPFTIDDWSSGNPAAFGFGTSNVGGYGGGFSADPFSDATINTAAGLSFYEGQAFLPSPIPEPLGALAIVAALGFTVFRRQRPLD